MIIEFASEVSNLAWRVSQSHNGGAIFARTKWSPMFGSVVFDYQWCILIVMSVKSSFYNEYDIKNNEKPVFWAQRGFQNHHQTFHDRCPEKIGPLPKKSDHWSTRTCPENIRPAPTWSMPIVQVFLGQPCPRPPMGLSFWTFFTQPLLRSTWSAPPRKFAQHTRLKRVSSNFVLNQEMRKNLGLILLVVNLWLIYWWIKAMVVPNIGWYAVVGERLEW